MKGETVLILANAEWDWANRVNCHHIAERLARENEVLFVETVGGRTPAPREMAKVARRLRKIAGGTRRINDGLTVLSPFVIPLYGSDRMREFNTWLLAQQVKRAVPSTARPILWIFLPSLVGLVGRMNERLVIYHCVDEHAANPNVPAQQVLAWEERLLKEADAVFITSAPLFEDKRSLNPHTFYMPNVADTDHLRQALDSSVPPASELDQIPRPIAGFVGNLTAYKIDFDLVSAAACANPNWSFVLIGPVGRGDPSTRVTALETCANVFLLGEKPYSDLPRYIKGFDACLIPFNQNSSTRGSLPMKFFEYLSAGKPVVATDLPTLAEFKGYFYPIRNIDEFSRALVATQTEDPALCTRRIALAQRYSWAARMKEIDTALESIPARSTKTAAAPHRSLALGAKRLLDVAISLLLLIILSPLLLAIALAIRLSSGSPVLYDWNVVGQGGRPFSSHKFRTMVRDADRLKPQLLQANEMRGPVFKMKEDPRVTAIGRILRRYSLDELPQLWSVFKGDMSLVGPRPPLVYEYEQFTPQQKEKLTAKPGMTCLWQVRGKPADFDQWLKLDLEYIDHWSLWLDLKILLQTAFVVLTGKNY